MKERLKQLRKALSITQAEFGKKIGVSQSTYGDIESGKNKLTQRNFETICRVFNVNPQWLSEGKGEMFLPSKEPEIIEQLAIEKNLTDEEVAMIQSFLDLPPEMRQSVIEFGRNFLRNMSKKLGLAEPKFSDERPPDEQLSVDEKRRIVNEELDAEKKGQMSYPSTGSNGLSLKRSRQNS